MKKCVKNVQIYWVIEYQKSNIHNYLELVLPELKIKRKPKEQEKNKIEIEIR